MNWLLTRIEKALDAAVIGAGIYFGVPEFKATGWETYGLPKLVKRGALNPPKSRTPEHAAWSKVHRASPGKGRRQERSETPPGCAAAYAEQWGGS